MIDNIKAMTKRKEEFYKVLDKLNQTTYGKAGLIEGSYLSRAIYVGGNFIMCQRQNGTWSNDLLLGRDFKEFAYVSSSMTFEEAMQCITPNNIEGEVDKICSKYDWISKHNGPNYFITIPHQSNRMIVSSNGEGVVLHYNCDPFSGNQEVLPIQDEHDIKKLDEFCKELEETYFKWSYKQAITEFVLEHEEFRITTMGNLVYDIPSFSGLILSDAGFMRCNQSNIELPNCPYALYQNYIKKEHWPAVVKYLEEVIELNKPVEELTLEQICAELGREVKVVK